MATRKLIAGLNKAILKDLGAKIKIAFDEKGINAMHLEALKLILATASTRNVVEFAFRHLAVSELNKQKSIHGFPSYDYMQKLISLDNENPQKICAVYIPTWMVVATSKVVMDKYKKLEFESTEEIIDLVISFTAEQTKYLWNPDL